MQTYFDPTPAPHMPELTSYIVVGHLPGVAAFWTVAGAAYAQLAERGPRGDALPYRIPYEGKTYKLYAHALKEGPVYDIYTEDDASYLSTASLRLRQAALDNPIAEVHVSYLPAEAATRNPGLGLG